MENLLEIREMDTMAIHAVDTIDLTEESSNSCPMNPSPAIVEDDQTIPLEDAFDGETKEQNEPTDPKIVEENEFRARKLKQFQHLLTKSQFYTKFLSNRIADQIKEQKNETSQRKNKEINENIEIRSRRDRPIKKKLQLCDYLNDQEIKETLAESSSPIKNKPEETQETFVKNINGQLVSNRQPKWLSGGILKRYQLDGYEWLRSLYQNGLNAILADEMGLGKTIQTIALICHLIEENIPGPHLIIAPLSTLANWISEFEKFAPDVPVALYHGTAETRHVLCRRMQFKVKARDTYLYPVVVSNYETVLKDSKKLQNINWKFIIIDEGHRIKNFDCLLIRALRCFRSKNRLLLTGTPLQNNLKELWSLLNYILPEIFDKLSVFESLFDVTTLNNAETAEKIAEEEQQNHIVSMIHEILSPFLLRRLKCDVDLNLPPKKEVLVYAPLTTKQQEYYKRTVDRTILTHLEPTDDKPLPAKRKRKSRHPQGFIRQFLDDDIYLEDILDQQQTFIDHEEAEKDACEQIVKKGVKNVSLQNIMMQLRKCCNHPYLIYAPLNCDGEIRIDEELVQTSGKLIVLDAMLPKLRERGHKILLFSQMTSLLEFLQDYCDLRHFKYSILDGSMSLAERNENIQKFDRDPETFLFLLSTRAGGLGLNLTAADTVFIYDSDWNPQCDLQAIDRCHRIRQTRPVVIYRLVTANTIDQKIVERASSKRKLEKLVMHKDKFKIERKNEKKYFTKNELLELLKSRDHEREVQTGTENNVFTDDELEALLDRSQMTSSTHNSKQHIFKIIETDETEQNFHFLAQNN